MTLPVKLKLELFCSFNDVWSKRNTFHDIKNTVFSIYLILEVDQLFLILLMMYYDDNNITDIKKKVKQCEKDN